MQPPINTKLIKGNEKYFKKILCEELRHRVFHITNRKGFDGIIADNAIYNSSHENVKNHNWGNGEKNSKIYFRDKNCVSVIDFFHNTDKILINDAIRKYRFYDIHHIVFDDIAYIFVLKESEYDTLITWEMVKKKNDWIGSQIVPNMKSGMPNKILLDSIDYMIKLDSDTKYVDLHYEYSQYFKGNKESK